MLTANQLLIQSWDLYKKNARILTGYVAWLLLPYAVLILISTIKNSGVFTDVIVNICGLAQSLIGLWLAIFIPKLIYLIFKKEKINLPNLQQQAWKIIPSVVWVAILQALATIGLPTALMVLGLFGVPMALPLGLILLIPGIFLWVKFAFSQIAAIIDEKRGRSALVFSLNLVQGKFWPVLWRLIFGPLIFGLGGFVLSGLIIVLIALATGTSFDTIISETPPLWADVITTVVEIFILPLFMIYTTLLYLNVKKVDS
jgi:hypothetical protein